MFGGCFSLYIFYIHFNYENVKQLKTLVCFCMDKLYGHFTKFVKNFQTSLDINVKWFNFFNK